MSITLVLGLISNELLLDHLRIQNKIRRSNKTAITCGLFSFLKFNEIPENEKEDIDFKNVVIDDFRIRCLYEERFTGCEADKEYIGKEFFLLRDTENFRLWPSKGYIGPWSLANMVLGGLFSVDTCLAQEVGGLDPSFREWGFEETTLASKLIAFHNSYVIPVSRCPAIHIWDNEVAMEKEERKEQFRKAHKRFELYANQNIEIIKKEIETNGERFKDTRAVSGSC